MNDFAPIVEPIMTAPRDQGREITVVVRAGNRDRHVRAYWWRHWCMADGVWWSPQHGAVNAHAWLAIR